MDAEYTLYGFHLNFSRALLQSSPPANALGWLRSLTLPETSCGFDLTAGVVCLTLPNTLCRSKGATIDGVLQVS